MDGVSLPQWLLSLWLRCTKIKNRKKIENYTTITVLFSNVVFNIKGIILLKLTHSPKKQNREKSF